MPKQKRQHLKRRADGRYCCVYHGRQFMGRTEEEALQKRDEYIRNEKRGLRHETQTLKEYADFWLSTRTVKPNTLSGYQSIVSNALAPLLPLPLQSITSDSVSSMYATLAKRSASYIHKTKLLLVSILDSAVDAGYILRNPARAQSIKPPRGTAGTHRVLTPEEQRLIMTVPHRFQLLALVMLFCGLRRGEALAISGDDIGDEITVNKAVTFRGNTPVISTTKTRAGVRRVPYPPFLPRPKGLLAGKLLTEQAFTRGWESYLHTLSRAAGHPVHFRPHDLRHTYATALMTAGVDMSLALRWLGHSDERMILRIYDHPGAERENAAKKLLFAAYHMQIDMQDKPPNIENPCAATGSDGIECLTTNQKVVGSNPAGRAKFPGK